LAEFQSGGQLPFEVDMTELAADPLVRTSLTDMVYQRLLDDILAGTLPSGSPVNAGEVAARFGVSPSPVREAVLRLASEGLITAPTNRRAAVVSFDRREVDEIFQLREILECAAVRLTAERIDAAGVEALRRAAQECAALYGDPARKKEMLDLDNRFHMLIAQAAGNRALRDEVLRVSRRVRVMQRLRMAPLRMEVAFAEHLAVVDGLSRRDPAGAEKAMRRHIRASCEYVLEGMTDDGAGR
jgi:DNA-binding GntR family transcriptional regulator